MFPVAEELHDRIRDPPDTELQRRAVLDKPGDEGADLLVRLDLFGRLVPLHLGELLQREGDLHAVVDPVHMNEAVAEGPGHVRVYLGDDDLRHLGRRFRALDPHPETAIAVLVGGRNLYESNIHRVVPAVQERGDL